MQPEPEPLPVGQWSLPQGLFLITEDELSVAPLLEVALRQRRVSVAIIERNSLQTPEALAEVVSQLRQQYGPVAGILHAGALTANPQPLTLSQWRLLTQIQAKSLFSLLQLCYNDLQATSGRVLMASAFGGCFGRDGNGGNSLAIAGCSNGILKTLSAESPNITVKAVDLDTRLSPNLLAESLVEELLLPGGRIEVGYPQGQRTIFRTQLAPLLNQGEQGINYDQYHKDTKDTKFFSPTADWVVLITGGARGITAEIASELAAIGLTLVLVGSTPLIPETTDQIETVAELRQFLLARSRAEGRSPTPVQIEREIQAILRAREIRSNLARFQELGARVEYLVADVRDESSFSATIESIYTRYGRLDAVIHGAGIIEDKLIVNKELTSFERVFDTKVDSAFILSRRLRPESLKWLVFFSSVAGRYGNRGQSDYAAANEVLNRLAWQLDKQWTNTRVVAINWGPWETTGMASEAVKQQFRERGVIPISLAAGRRFFWDELIYGQKGMAEVIAGEAPWETHEKSAGKLANVLVEKLSTQSVSVGNANPLYPFISHPPQLQPNSKVTLEHIFSLENDPYLEDHCLDSKAVLPATGAIEWLAEFTQVAWPDWQVCEIRDLKVLRGVALEVGSSRRVILSGSAASHADATALQVTAEILDPETKIALYRAYVLLRPQLEMPPLLPIVPVKPEKHLTPEIAYQEYLFHGRRFQLVSEIIAIDELGIDAWVNLSQPSAWVANSNNHWLFDPGLLDTVPQMALVWSRLYQGSSALPSRFGCVRRYSGYSLTGKLKMVWRVKNHNPQTIVYDAAFLNEQGQLLLQLENLESTCSAELNRLNDQWRISQGMLPLNQS